MRIYLDSIELPFVLLSILFAVYYAKSESHYSHTNESNKNILLILLSGIFLGLAIFTKIPVFTMFPLIAFIILKKTTETPAATPKSIVASKLSEYGLCPLF
jgi:4-amino-4-deoxy-L-arabinose transferase-like glycosyltransferase